METIITFEKIAPSPLEVFQAYWQPIDSAPKDGTRILAITKWGNSYRVDTAYWETQPYHKKPRPFWRYDAWRSYCSRERQPTHWMPLPEPPKSDEIPTSWLSKDPRDKIVGRVHD